MSLESISDFFARHDPANISDWFVKNKSLLTYTGVACLIGGGLINNGLLTGFGLTVLIMPYLFSELIAVKKEPVVKVVEPINKLELLITCVRCNTVNKNNSVYCLKCGEKLIKEVSNEK